MIVNNVFDMFHVFSSGYKTLKIGISEAPPLIASQSEELLSKTCPRDSRILILDITDQNQTFRSLPHPYLPLDAYIHSKTENFAIFDMIHVFSLGYP